MIQNYQQHEGKYGAQSNPYGGGDTYGTANPYGGSVSSRISNVTSPD